jgi:omega-amidase
MDKLSVSLIQSDLQWQDIKHNLKSFQQKIDSISVQTDIIVLPEMFSTGFTMEPFKFAETMNGQSVNWMKEMAIRKKSMIIGSLAIKENEAYVNRLFAVFPDGGIEFYDKRHLFALAGENNFYKKGERKNIFTYKTWRINPQICYDLRFPVWSRFQEDYDLMVYVANWPATRSFHWKILLQARAIENQAYVLGVNRIGQDGTGTRHTGDSCAFDPMGHNISTIQPDSEMIDTILLDKQLVEKIRKSFPFSNDRDQFIIC